MSSSGSSNKPRTVRLRCPSVSSTVSFFAWDDQRLDLGSIARTFGLDPSTLKLNGYFISRGVDLVSSSVTWRSLLSFFSAKGLSTGKDDKEALVVDGNLSKVGNKRKLLEMILYLLTIYFKELWVVNSMSNLIVKKTLSLLWVRLFRILISCCWEFLGRKKNWYLIGTFFDQEKLFSCSTIFFRGQGILVPAYASMEIKFLLWAILTGLLPHRIDIGLCIQKSL